LSWLNSEQVSSVSKELVKDYHIKTPNEKAMAGTLSGGNIQRLMLARAFSQESKLVIAHNPTRGLDIASVEFVLKKIVELKSQGVGVLYLSEDLDEMLLICDRIGVIYKGEIVGILTRERFDKYKIGLSMLGVERIENA
jgi:simple sugar transport system ATP-binding protein